MVSSAEYISKKRSIPRSCFDVDRPKNAAFGNVLSIIKLMGDKIMGIENQHT
jgi:hypothetical protein